MSINFEICSLAKKNPVVFHDYDPSKNSYTYFYPNTSFKLIEDALKIKFIPQEMHFSEIIEFALHILKHPEKFEISDDEVQTKKFTLAKLIKDFPISKLSEWSIQCLSIDNLIAICLEKEFFDSFEFIESIHKQVLIGKYDILPSLELLKTCIAAVHCFEFLNESTKNIVFNVKSFTGKYTIDFRNSEVNSSYETLRWILALDNSITAPKTEKISHSILLSEKKWEPHQRSEQLQDSKSSEEKPPNQTDEWVLL